MKKNFISTIVLSAFIAITLQHIHADEKQSSGSTGSTSQIKVGFFGTGGRSGIVWRKFGPYELLKKNGFVANNINSEQWFFGRVPKEDILIQLNQYHVVFPDIFRGHLNLNYRETTANYRAALEEYVKSGGGLFIVASSPGYYQDRRDIIFNILFNDFGVKMTKEGICDLTREYQYPNHPFLSKKAPAAPSYLRFFHTDNIASSPVTGGVKNLFMPQWGDCGMWGTMLLKFDDNWQIVARGADTAKSYMPDFKGSKNGLYVIPGSVTSAPPLAAWRNYGKGKIFVYSVNSMHLLNNTNAKGWPGVHEYAGNGKIPSDGNKLMFNAIEYMGHNALAYRQLGSYQEQALPSSVGITASVNLDARRFPPPGKTEWRGLIGLHSILSDGAGSVEEYVKAARAANYRFIVFTESLEKLTAENFSKLKEECTKYSNPDFYACPGIEFTASGGLRWAVWGEDVKFPGKHVMSKDDAAIVHWWGTYIAECNRTPTALLNYNRLHQIGDPANLWWYNRIPVWVRRKGKLLANHVQEYAAALADLRGIGPFVFNGIYSPADISDESACNRVPGGKREVKAWLNSKNIYDCDLGYPSEGPTIRQWSILNDRNQFLHNRTVGSQRIRCRVAASSPNGLNDISIYAADGRLLRYFKCPDVQDFTVDFELVHDRRMDIFVLVSDSKGKQAVSSANVVWQYFYNIGRCTDNLNLLSYSTLSSHPDRHEYPSQREYEGREYSDQAPIHGIDTIASDDHTFAPYSKLNISVMTYHGNQLGGSNQLDNWNSMPLRFPFTSAGISIIEASSEYRIDTHSRHTQKRRISYSDGPFYGRTEPQPFADIQLRSYLLRSRIRPDISQTAFWLAAEEYRGGVMIHEIELKIKKDLELKGEIPIQIITVDRAAPGYFKPKNGYWNRLMADTVNGPFDTKPENILGEMMPNGFVTITSQNSKRKIILLTGRASLPVRFKTGPGGGLLLGMGCDKMKLHEGDIVKLRLAVITGSDAKNSIEEFKKLADFYNLAESAGLRDYTAENGEILISTGPDTETICDTAFTVSKIADNGCAGYFELTGSKRFIFAPVKHDVIYFQCNTDLGAKIWAGNIFIVDNPALKMTLTVDGQLPGKSPKLEIHNPTGSTIHAMVSSPASTPLFGGTKFQVDVPAGTSIEKILETKK